MTFRAAREEEKGTITAAAENFDDLADGDLPVFLRKLLDVVQQLAEGTVFLFHGWKNSISDLVFRLACL
ncbi:hypothetical protein ACFSHP_22305 [Novosphingobium panipatense]